MMESMLSHQFAKRVFRVLAGIMLACAFFQPIELIAQQWTRVERDGRWVCERTPTVGVDVEDVFVPPYTSKGNVTEACKTVSAFEEAFTALFGLSIAQAQLSLFMPPTPPPPPPTPFPSGWSDLTLDGGVLAWSSTLGFNEGTGEFSIADGGGQAFGTSDHTRVFDRTGGVSSDMTLTVRITASEIDGTPPAAKPFIMVRGSTAANSKNLHAGIRGDTGRRVYERATDGDSTVAIVTDTGTTTWPMCLRVSVDVDNDSARFEQSANCSAFTPMGVDLVRSWLGSTFRVNIGCSANNDADPDAKNTCVFDNVTFSTAPVNHVGTPMSDTPDYEDVNPDGALVGVTTQSGRTLTSVANSAALPAAMADQDCKETLQLANGTYTGNYTFTANCAADVPFIVECLNPGMCTLANGTWTMTGARNQLRRVHLSNVNVVIDGDNNKLLQFTQTGWSGVGISPRNISGTGKNCEIAYGEQYSPTAFGPSDGSTQIRMGIRSQENGLSTFHKGCWIHHMDQHDFPAKPDPNLYSSGQSDADEVCETNNSGTYRDIDAGWYFEDILVRDHLQGNGTADAASFDLKCGGIVVRRMTFDNVYGFISMRGSTYYPSTFEGIWMDDDAAEGIAGIRGDGMRVIGNRVSGNLYAYAGDLACTGQGSASLRAAACNPLIVGNIVNGITYIGYEFSSATFTVPLSDGIIRAHTGTIVANGSNCAGPCVTNLTNTPSAAAGLNYTPAVKLTPADVGPDKISDAPTAYKQARDLL